MILVALEYHDNAYFAHAINYVGASGRDTNRAIALDKVIKDV